MGKELIRSETEFEAIVRRVESSQHCIWDRFRCGPDFYPCVAVWTVDHSRDSSYTPLIVMDFVYLEDFGVERSD